MEHYFTKVVTLLTPPSDDATAELDRWENTLLTAMRSNGVVLDISILNSLLQRRTIYRLSVDQPMALANRKGLSSDEVS